MTCLFMATHLQVATYQPTIKRLNHTSKLYSRFVPGTMDRDQNKQQVLFSQFQGQPARVGSNLVCFALLPESWKSRQLFDN